MAFISFTKIPVVRAIQMLHFYFTGISLQLFTFLDPVNKTSLDIFKRAFFDRFKPSSPINKDLLRIQQQPGEGVEEYLYRVRKLATDSIIGWISSDGVSQEWTSSKTPRTCCTSATNNVEPAKGASHPGRGCSGFEAINIQPNSQCRLANKRCCGCLTSSSHTSSHDEHYAS